MNVMDVKASRMLSDAMLDSLKDSLPYDLPLDLQLTPWTPPIICDADTEHSVKLLDTPTTLKG